MSALRLSYVLSFLLLGIAWLLLYLLAAGLPLLSKSTWLELAFPELLKWLVWGGVAPTLVSYVRAQDALQPPMTWRWLKHFGLGLGIAGLVFVASGMLFAGYDALLGVLGEPLQQSLVDRLRYMAYDFFSFGLPLNLIIYAGLAAGAIATRYLRDLQQEQQRTASLQTQLVEAQLGALKMQLQPHFLFNTLNTISATLHADPGLADRMLAELGDFLRRTLLHADVTHVRLDAEVDFCQQYLRIEQHRLEARLQVEVQLDEDTVDAAVPHLILQPLVENAVQHGVAKHLGTGTVRITAHREGGHIVISVKNSVRPGTSSAGSASGIGLSTTRDRLRAGYGSAAQLTLNFEEDTATAQLTLPYQRSFPTIATPANSLSDEK